MRHLIRCLLALIAAPLSFAAPDVVVVDAADPRVLTSSRADDAQLARVDNEAGPAIRAVLGETHRWPGVGFVFPEGLDASGHGQLTFHLKNAGDRSVQVRCRIDSLPTRDDNPDTLTRRHDISLLPGATKEVRIPLVPYVAYEGVSPDDFFGMRGIPFFNNDAMHLAHLTQVLLFVVQDNAPRTIEVGSLRLTGDPAAPSDPPPPAEVFPLIDAFGQFKHKDWPGKTHSVEQMIASRAAEAKQLAATPPPASWNRYGGWKDGPQFEATGWFRTAKHNGKWTLVDPDGRLFFSLGIDGVAFRHGTILDQREHWFEHVPPDNDANQTFYFPWTPDLKRSHWYQQSVRAFSFQKYNISRKYGRDWERSFAHTATQRLPAWGINTLGNWSSPDIYSLGKLPYVGYIRPDSVPLEGSTGHWGKFKDVFDPSFAASIREQLGGDDLAPTTRDPMCIGYFVDNELTFGDDTTMATATLSSPANQSAKQVFQADLEKKYRTIDALNQAWQTDHDSWASLLSHTQPPTADGAHADLAAFTTKFIRTYFQTVRQAVKSAAPNHLYLGCRYGSGAALHPVALAADAEFSDVVSLNIYSRFLSDKIARIDQIGDKPCLIGEFHFGALDRGLFDTGLVKVADQNERAQAFYQFVADCVRHPNIVGCHWFQFCDSPTTGRLWDSENYQIGFTDTCDSPYPELIEASRRAGENLYP